jgi:hypothetical protein
MTAFAGRIFTELENTSDTAEVTTPCTGMIAAGPGITKVHLSLRQAVLFTCFLDMNYFEPLYRA